MRYLLLLSLTLLAACMDTPKPMPYLQREVRIAGPAGDLAGELVLPNGAGPFPAVILIAGSGAQTRDENVAGHPIFRVMAASLAQAGIASFRYDKRGAGQSAGDFDAALISDFAADAGAAFDWLAAQPEINADAVALLGHSEGGLVAPMAASGRKVAALVLMAAPGVTMDLVVRRQQADIARAQGDNEASIAVVDAALAAAFDGLRAAPNSAAARPAMARALGALTNDPRKLDELIAKLSAPWLYEATRLDPAVFIAAYDGPVLALWGDKDLQVAATQNARALQPFLHNPKSRVEIIAGLNHLFQHSKTGNPKNYGDAVPTPALEVTVIVGEFLHAIIANRE